jgi:hypothetical protein
MTPRYGVRRISNGKAVMLDVRPAAWNHPMWAASRAIVDHNNIDASSILGGQRNKDFPQAFLILSCRHTIGASPAEFQTILAVT